MLIAIAGASGMLGTALTGHLRHNGHEVVRLVRGEATAPDTRGWDPSFGRIDPGTLEGVDAVVNLYSTGLAGKRWSETQKRKIRDSRVIPARTLAEAVAKAGVPLLLNGSGTSYYGDTGGRVADESAAAGEDFLARVCREWEEAAASAADAGTRVVLLRTGVVLSRAGGALATMTPAFRLLLGARLGSGSQYVPWISVGDTVAAIRHLLEGGHAATPVAGPVNLTAPNPVTNREFTHALARALHRPAPWVAPRPLVRAVLGEYADGLFITQRVAPAVLTGSGFTFRHPSLEDALASLFPA